MRQAPRSAFLALVLVTKVTRARIFRFPTPCPETVESGHCGKVEKAATPREWDGQEAVAPPSFVVTLPRWYSEADLETDVTSTLPSQHAAFLERLVDKMRQDDRFEALLAGGSMVHGGFDELSDLDLVPVVRDAAYAQVTTQKRNVSTTMRRPG
jgi:hypothetical protein